MQNNQNMYDKKYICPICSNEFTSKTVKTTSKRISKQDSDFFKHYISTDNPYYYEIIVCPKCGYASSTSYFDNISDTNKNIIEEKISTQWSEKSFGDNRTIDQAISCFKLALHEATLINISNIRIGKLCLKIAWLYRIKYEIQKENDFLQFALNYFMKAYDYDKFPEDNINLCECTYLIGELNRRLENYDEAIKWFNVTLKTKDISPKINKLTREQWFIAREEHVNDSKKIP